VLPLGLARVRGESMLPTLRAGDLVLVRYAARVRPGSLVLARFADGTLAVKRAEGRRTSRTGGPAWWLLSDNPDQGVDSRHRGAIAEEDVRGVVLARIWPRPGRLRPASG
jgi:phage repressor protein C with HTH and peptisase S24 domain